MTSFEKIPFDEATSNPFLFELEEDRAPSFAKGFAQLKALGFFSEWEVERAGAELRALGGKDPAKLLGVDVGTLLQLYYGAGLSERGRADGVLVVDARFGKDVASEVRALCPNAPALERAPDLSEGLGPLLRALGARTPGRFFELDFDGDFAVVAYRDPDFDRRARELSFLSIV